MRPIQAVINLSSLQSNLNQVKKLAPHSFVWAVIKANAYGHGALKVAEALNKADGFAVLQIKEAIALRKQGLHKPILLLEGFFDSSEINQIIKYNLIPVIHNSYQLKAICNTSKEISIVLKLNTGMNRLGFSYSNFEKIINKISKKSNINIFHIMTHFATADDEQGVDKPLAIFDKICSKFKFSQSLANSAAILKFPNTHRDWVRPGIMLYGVSPFSNTTATDLGLMPVMSLQSKVIAVHHLKKGAAVGYGNTFIAEQDIKVGVVACGYADGYPRTAPNGTSILVNGYKTRLIGRVSMDMLCVNLTNIDNADINSPVTLWGEGLPIEALASAVGTIGYELLCNISQRVPLIYK